MSELIGIVRYSIFRLFSDLIRADKVVAEEEIKFLNQVCNSYGITSVDRENSLNVPLGDAISVLSKQRSTIRCKIVEDMKRMSLSDGFCCREEALILMAATSCLEKNDKSRYEVVSSPCFNIDFDDSQVIYLESRKVKSYNDYIGENHRQISSTLKLAGFDFVYIPAFANHYARYTNQSVLHDIVALLAPTLSANETVNVMECITHMSTKFFYEEIVCRKLNIKVDVTTPIILIKIGNNIVNGVNTANFLSVKLDREILPQVEALTDKFLLLQRCPTIEIRNNIDSKGDFIYTGFYKTLFDMLTARKGSRCSLVINVPSLDGKSHKRDTAKYLSVNSTQKNNSLKLDGKDAVFYIFILFESIINEGFLLARMPKDRESQITRFEKLYFQFSKNTSDAPDISNQKITSPMLSHIKSAITNNEHLLEKAMYSINKATNGLLSIGLETHLIFVNEGNDQLVPLEKSDLFISYKSQFTR